MITLNFGDYKRDVDLIDFKLSVKKVLSNRDKRDLIELLWECVDWSDWTDILDDELRDIYPPDDYDVDKEIADYYDRVRM
jgi:hypothetical protein